MSKSEYDTLRNQYDGERVFLIGNGPSLNETPLSKLSDEYTFAVNKINKLYDETDWRPSFYLNTIGGDVSENIDCAKENAKHGAVTFVDEEYKHQFSSYSNVFKINPEGVTHKLVSYQKNELENIELSTLLEYWSDDIFECVYSFNSIYIMMQIINYLGFNKVYLLGCDLNYGKSDSHLIFDDGLDPIKYVQHNNKTKKMFLKHVLQGHNRFKSIVNGIHIKLSLSYIHRPYLKTLQKAGMFEDNDHFVDTYRGPTMISRMMNSRNYNEELKKAHLIIDRITENKKINVYNSTLGGELEIYERVPLTNII